MKASNILCISSDCNDEKPKQREQDQSRRWRTSLTCKQGNGYFSKLLIISFLCPLNEGYKVNTLYNKAPADEKLCTFSTPSSPLPSSLPAPSSSGHRKTWTLSGGISWLKFCAAIYLPRPVCISFPALPVNVVSCGGRNGNK